MLCHSSAELRFLWWQSFLGDPSISGQFQLMSKQFIHVVTIYCRVYGIPFESDGPLNVQSN